MPFCSECGKGGPGGSVPCGSCGHCESVVVGATSVIVPEYNAEVKAGEYLSEPTELAAGGGKVMVDKRVMFGGLAAILLLLMAIVVIVSSNGESAPPDPCASVDCGGHGKCTAGICRCNAIYAGQHVSCIICRRRAPMVPHGRDAAQPSRKQVVVRANPRTDAHLVVRWQRARQKTRIAGENRCGVIAGRRRSAAAASCTLATGADMGLYLERPTPPPGPA